MLVGKNKKTLLKLALIGSVLVCFALFFVAPDAVFAQGEVAEGEAAQGLEDTGQATGLEKGDPRRIIIRIVQAFLGLLGIIALIVMLYAGWRWMTSGNEPNRIAAAKKTLLNGVIGLVIILGSYAFTIFIFNMLLGATGVGTVGGPGGGGVPGGGIGALGNGIIQSHWPPRNGTDIPRNTKIIITFKEPMDLGTVRTDPLADSALKTDVIRILERDRFADGDPSVIPIGGTVSATSDKRTISIKPDVYLGNPIDNVWYRVGLTDVVLKEDGTPAFDPLGTYSLDDAFFVTPIPSVPPGTPVKFGYHWDFRTSTELDTTPPRVKRVVPVDNATGIPPNVVVQITFTEEVDPTTTTGIVPGFTNINLAKRAPAPPLPALTGIYSISSNYRTVTFISDDPCGTNSCGDTVYCLPFTATIDGTVKAATLQNPGADPPDPAAIALPDGVVDMVGNSLDGNGNGTAEGTAPPPDDFHWSFDTGDEMDLTPPRLEIVGADFTPYLEPLDPLASSNVDLQDPVRMHFNELLNAATLKPDSGYKGPHEYITLLYPLADPIAYTINNTTGDGCTSQCLFRGNSRKGFGECGDGTVEPLKGEACDDGNNRNGDGCSSECLYEPSAVCGDGVVGRGEDCDDGGADAGDGCSEVCLWEGNITPGGDILADECGNGVINYGEECDDGENPPLNGNGCSDSCLREHPTPAGMLEGFCGDGTVQRLNNGIGEDCDDKNNEDGDGCSSFCESEGGLCGDGNLDRSLFPDGGGEECDPLGVAGCSTSCLYEGNPVMGSAIGECGTNPLAPPDTVQGEACDDGNPIDKTMVSIVHSDFADMTDYGARIGSGVQDGYQNCFTPSGDNSFGSLPTDPLGCNGVVMGAGVVDCVAN